METRSTTSRPWASIDVFDRLEDARADWLALLAVAPASPYQSFDVIDIWSQTIGRADGVRPFIVVARDADRRPIALLPLGLVRQPGLTMAGFLGGRDVNFNLALLQPGIFDSRELRALLQAAARARRVDLYWLRNQPRRFAGVDNPLAFSDAQDSASFGYGATLPTTQVELAARLSKDTRKKLRKKEARLAESGPLSYEHRASGARAQAIIDALLAQKSARFSQMGVTQFGEPAMRSFIERLAAEGGDVFELHALSVGDRVVATYAGFSRGGRFSAMLNSFDMDEEIARCSPGDLLLHELMRHLVERGMTHFDLGAGEARYKQSVCDETIELCDATMAISARGKVAAPALTLLIALKRRVKQSPRLSALALRLRSLLRRS